MKKRSINAAKFNITMKYPFLTTGSLFLLSWLILFNSCDNEQFDDQIPFVSFPDISINLKSQQFLTLQSQGYLTIDNGLKGIILYKATFGDEYTAFDRSCSYQPNDSCALVEVATSGLFMQDLCCSSSFEFSQGNPTGGPAKNPLRRYRTYLNGDFLTITDEPR